MPRRWDDRALEALPLRLMIVALVASMSVLPAAQALSGFEDREFMRRAEMQLDRLVTASQILTVQGPGNVRTLSLDFTSSGRLAFDRLRVGDRPDGPNASGVIVLLNNGARVTRLAMDPACTLCSKDGSVFVSTQPAFDLRLTALMENRTILVRLEMV